MEFNPPMNVEMNVWFRDDDFYPNDIVCSYPLYPESAEIDTNALDLKIENIFSKSLNATRLDIFPTKFT